MSRLIFGAGERRVDQVHEGMISIFWGHSPCTGDGSIMHGYKCRLIDRCGGKSL